MILIGCPPFEDKYVPLIMQRRMERLAVQEQTDFLQLLSHTHLSDDEFIRLQDLVARTDNYHVKVNKMILLRINQLMNKYGMKRLHFVHPMVLQDYC